jgi:hypothetical protein
VRAASERAASGTGPVVVVTDEAETLVDAFADASDVILRDTRPVSGRPSQ